MWILIFLFGLSSFAIGWVCFGYYILLFIMGGLREEKKQNPVSRNSYPFLTLIVPCYNEGENISRKIANLKELDYPDESMEIIFADGGSMDETRRVIEEKLDSFKEAKLILCPQKGKVSQINHVLPSVKGAIVINTDVDSYMKDSCLLEIVKEFQKNPQAIVVGACSTPQNTIEIEEYYWLGQNKGRILETRALTSSITIAICYAFKKELIDQFPEDVIADDIYIAYLANTKGYETIYSEVAIAEEIRSPKSLSEFLSHKFRKSNAFLRETLRFVYQLPEMGSLWQLIYLTKLSQLLFLPWLGTSWLILGISLASLKRWDITFLGFLFVFVLGITTSHVFKLINVPGMKKKYSFGIILKTFLLSNLILLATGLSYPFFKQNSNYKKLENF